jgi:hypothetical protein
VKGDNQEQCDSQQHCEAKEPRWQLQQIFKSKDRVQQTIVSHQQYPSIKLPKWNQAGPSVNTNNISESSTIKVSLYTFLLQAGIMPITVDKLVNSGYSLLAAVKAMEPEDIDIMGIQSLVQKRLLMNFMKDNKRTCNQGQNMLPDSALNMPSKVMLWVQVCLI